ncbi:hypothetical protein BCR32DRAFT_267517 [Anaeromyces robustus]|uniref:Uncharacterized protein n=1 Tax=Anaeromyces robustus TaxID=1754192 RepID=A0A1Y1XAA5_9FUNG|nr:hypothetical protein BCR32DRAFT_267517 [Anaeromyces robustus]|eukprot:ORX82659.1 hypothetical protein BCR32DRAFT_267517 [Anaeromyces robustus]
MYPNIFGKKRNLLNDKLNNISSSSKEILEFYWYRDMNSDKSIKTKTYKMNSFEKSRNYLKLYLEFPEYSKDSLFNSLVVTSENSSVDNRINNIVMGYKSSNNIRINSISNIDILENMVLVIEITIVHTKRNGNVCLSVRLNLVLIQNLHSCCDLRLY